MNNSVSNFVEASNLNQNSTDTSCDSPALFHHGVPLGTYKAEVVAASRKVNPETNCDTIRIDMNIEEGPHTGHPLSKYYNQSSKDAVRFFKREMGAIGRSVSTRKDLDTLCTSIVGDRVLAQVANHPNGNQVILLKGQSLKKAPVVDPDSLWV